MSASHRLAVVRRGDVDRLSPTVALEVQGVAVGIPSFAPGRAVPGGTARGRGKGSAHQGGRVGVETQRSPVVEREGGHVLDPRPGAAPGRDGEGALGEGGRADVDRRLPGTMGPGRAHKGHRRAALRG